MEFETKVYQQIGGYGRYNRVVTVFSWFPNFAVSINLLCDVFFTLIPESYHCEIDPSLLPSSFLLRNFSRQAYLNFAIPWINGSGLSNCELYKYPTNFTNFTEKVYREVVPCTRKWEYTKPSGLRSNFVTEWDLVCGDYWKIPLQHVCFMSGWILGYVLLGSVCDWLGRRRALLLSVCLSGLLGLAVCLSNSPATFHLLRLCHGTMLAGVFLSSYVARLELCDPPRRLMVSMVSSFFSVFAELVLPGLAVLCGEWRVLQAVVTVPTLLLLSYWCWPSVFPESPRWLLATHQIPQAKRCLQLFVTRNGACVRDDLYPAESLLTEIDVSFPEETQPEYHHVLELRHTRVIWKNCLILAFTHFIGTGIQYCFTRNLHNYSPHFYFGYFLRALTGACACGGLCASVGRVGRRGVLLLTAIVTGLSSLLLLALTQCKPLPQPRSMPFFASGPYLPWWLMLTTGSAVCSHLLDLHGGLVVVLSLVGLLSSQALAMLSVFFAAEVMPTVVRGGALGLVMAAGCVGMAASSVMELQNNGGHFLHHVVFSSFAVLSVLCIMLLPESKNKALPDSLGSGEALRRPALFLSRAERDVLPLLRAHPPASEYSPDSYSRLVTATRKMLAKDTVPYRDMAASQQPLLPSNGIAQGGNKELS